MSAQLHPDLTVAEQVRAQTSVAMATGSISRVGGGVSTAVQGLSAALNARGTPVQILSQHDTHSAQDMHELDVLDVRLAPITGPISFAFSAQNRRAMVTLDADLVHLHGLWTGSSLNTQVWSLQKRPTIVSPHSMVDASALRARSVKKRVFWTLFEARTLGQARCTDALSRAEADAVCALGLKVPVAIIPNGIDLAQADATPPNPLWRAELREGARVVLFFGRLHLVVASPGPEPYVAELEALVAREFSWTSVAEKMTVLYAWAVGGGTPPDFVEF